MKSLACARGTLRKRRVEATAGIEPAIKVLQTSALPLGYVALFTKQDVFNLADLSAFFKSLEAVFF